MDGPAERTGCVARKNTRAAKASKDISASLVQTRAVMLPPIVTILAQLLMWILTGVLGVALATPLAAAGLVLVKMLYLHETVEYN